MAQEPLACLFELLPDSVILGAEFFYCFNPFIGAYERYLCCLTSALVSIFRITSDQSETEDDSSHILLHTVFQERVFGKLQTIKVYKRGGKHSDVLLIVLDECRLVTACYDPIRNVLDTLAVLDMDFGFFAANAKINFLGHGNTPIFILDIEHKVLGTSIYGEQLYFCRLGESKEGENGSILSEGFTVNLLRDHGLVGPILDIVFVYGSRYPTFAILQQGNFLPIGHAMRVMHTCVLSVFTIDFVTKKAVLLWKKSSLPHDCLQLLDVHVNSKLNGCVIVISQNAVLVVHEEVIVALPTNSFAYITLNTSKIRLLDATQNSLESGLELMCSHWVSYGKNHNLHDNSQREEEEISYVGFLQDGSVLLLHIQLVIPGLPSSLVMECVKVEDGIFARCVCYSDRMLFVGVRYGSNALYCIQPIDVHTADSETAALSLSPYSQTTNTFLRLSTTTTTATHHFASAAASAVEEINFEAEEQALYGPSANRGKGKPRNSQWMITLQLQDYFNSTGAFLTGNIVTRPMKDDPFSLSIDSIQWSGVRKVTTGITSTNPTNTTQSYIPERELRDQLVLSHAYDSDAKLSTIINGIRVKKVGSRSFPSVKTMNSVTLNDKLSLIFLSYSNNKTRLFLCTAATEEESHDSTVKFSECLAEEFGFINTARTIHVAIIPQLDADSLILVQITAYCIRFLRIMLTEVGQPNLFETEPVQDILIHDGYELGGLGGDMLQDEQIITADCTNTTSSSAGGGGGGGGGYVTVVSSQLTWYLLYFDCKESSAEVKIVYKSHDKTEDTPFIHEALEHFVTSPILTATLFTPDTAHGNLNIITTNRKEELMKRQHQQQVTTKDVKKVEKDKLQLEMELEELNFYGMILSDESKTATTTEEEDKAHLQAPLVQPLLKVQLQQHEGSSACSYLVLGEKNGTVSILQLPEMKLILQSKELFHQVNHIPLPCPATTVERDEENSASNFIVELRLFYVTSTRQHYLVLLFSSGEVVLYHFLTQPPEVAVALNKVFTYSLHSRGYPGVFFVRSDLDDTLLLPQSQQAAAAWTEYICRMGSPTIIIGTQGSTVYFSANDPKILTFDGSEGDGGLPCLTSVAFPETPWVNYGHCTIFPLFQRKHVHSEQMMLATLWYEYEDIDTASHLQQVQIQLQSSSTTRINPKNRPLKQGIFGVYSILPRQQKNRLFGSIQSQTISTQNETVHMIQEILRQYTDNKTEQALLEKKTFLLLTSNSQKRSFNPAVIDPEVDLENEDFALERYYPYLDSFQQPPTGDNPQFAPKSRLQEYKISLYQQGKIVDIFSFPLREKVLAVSICYFNVDLQVAKSQVEKRIFVLVSTITVDKRGEDSQGLGRLLLLGMDYAMFEEEEDVEESTEQQQQQEAEANGEQTEGNNGRHRQNGHEVAQIEEDGNQMDVDTQPQPGQKQQQQTKPLAAETATAAASKQEQFLHTISPKLRQLWVGPGPSSVLHQMSLSQTAGEYSNYVVGTVGPTVYVYRFNAATLEMDQVAFYFAQFYITSVTLIKQFILLSDFGHSVQLLYFREQDSSLHLIARDFDARVILQTEVMVDGPKLGLLAGDDRGHLQMFQCNAKKSESINGSRLLCLADYYLGSDISWMSTHDLLYPESFRRGAMIITPTAGLTKSTASANNVLVQRKISHFPLQQFGFRMLKTSPVANRKAGTIIATREGGLHVLIPLEEKMFKRLASLEQVLNMLLPPPLGVPARDYRLSRHSHQHTISAVNAKKTIIDGVSLFRYQTLEAVVQEEIAAMIGSNAMFLRENLREMEYSIRFF